MRSFWKSFFLAPIIPFFLFTFVLIEVSGSVEAASSGEAIFGLTTNNELILFSSSDPTKVERRIPLTGLTADEKMFSIDFRPCRCGLFGISVSPSENVSWVYDINYDTGVSVRKSSFPLIPTVGATPDSKYGVDFEPEGSLFTIVGPSGFHKKATVEFGEAGTYTSLSYAPGDISEGASLIGTNIAYSNNIPHPVPGATSLYGINPDTNSLIRIGDPGSTTSMDSGVAHTLRVFPFNVLSVEGFDITSSGGERAFGALQVEGYTGTQLVQVDLTNGNSSIIGTIGSGETLYDIAIAIAGRIQFLNPLYTIDEAGTAALITIERTPSTIGEVTIEYHTVDGSAKAGVDYTPVSGQITFNEGQSSGSFSVPIIDNTKVDRDRSFSIQLQYPQNGAVLDVFTAAEVKILDNEEVINITNPGGTPTNPDGTPGLVIRYAFPKTVKLKNLARSGMRGTFDCSLTCSLSLTIKTQARRPQVFIKQNFTVVGGTSKKVTFKVKKALQKKLLSLKKGPLVAEIVGADSLGVKNTGSQVIKVTK